MRYRCCLLLLTALIWIGCQQENKKTTVIASGRKAHEIPMQQIWGMRVLKTDSNVITYRMNAGYATRSNVDFNQNNITDFDSGFTVISYKDGRTNGRLDSRRGNMDNYRNVWIAIDSVVLSSPTGYTLYTDRLTWNLTDKRLYSETPVLSVRGADSLWGDGFVSTDNLEEYNIVNPRGKAFLADEKLKGAKEK